MDDNSYHFGGLDDWIADAIHSGVSAETIFNEIIKRMKLTIGVDYLSLPTHNSGLNYSFMRSLFLKRDANDFKNIAIEYPKHNYLITEADHNLSLDLVAKNDHYSIYKF